MQDKSKMSLTRKSLYAMMLLGLVFSAFSAGNLTPAYAQDGGTDTPATEVPVQKTPTPEPITDGQATATPEPATIISTPKVESQSIEPQIVGGTLATPGEYPWQVALIGGSTSDFYNGQFCGGSLIDDQWVLTAAHCVTEDNGSVSLPSSIDVVAGIWDLQYPAAGYQRRGVFQIIRHPAYNDNTLDSDVALLKLSSPVNIGGSGATSTAIIPIAPPALGGSLAGYNSWVSGWGNTKTTSYYGQGYPPQLREVQLPVMSDAVCNDYYHWGGQVTSNMICAGYDPGGYQSTCQGDSGGPAVVWNSSTSQWNLAGVVSFGPVGCAVPYAPSVFARVSQFGNWINQYLLDPAVLTSPYQNEPLVTNYNPVYTWNKVTDATWYRLYVSGPNGLALDQWFDASIACDVMGSCSATPGPSATLTGGDYSWWVMPWNSTGNGPWSAEGKFTTTAPTKPAATAHLAPTGPITTNYTPTFTWDTVGNATWYRLLVNGPNGTVLDKWYAASICSTGTCIVDKPVTLGGGSHDWWVLTWNSVGSTWSSGANFTTTMPTAPAATAHLAPTGPITTNYTPTFTWDTVGNATWYRLLVNGPNGTVLDKWYDASICSGGTCTVTKPVTLGGGSHDWWVLTWNSIGSTWSAGANFSTTALTMPAATGHLSPAGPITTNYTPTFTWDTVGNASWYRLLVNGPNGTVFDKWYDASVCSGGTCIVTKPVTLGGGSHDWWVLTWNSVGSTWSAGANFTTTALTVPAATGHLAPTGPITTNYTPTFTWDKVDGVTWYRFLIIGPNGTVIDKWYDASICSSGTCTVTKPVTLGGGSHDWWVLTWNSVGSTWSAGANFTTTMPTAPVATTLISPALPFATTDYTPTFTWNTVGNATWYRLLVNGPNGTVLDKWYDASICSGGTCTVTGPVTLGGGRHSWWVMTWNNAGSTWSAGANFITESPTIPVAVSNLSPTGTGIGQAPMYTWTKVDMATWYRLYVKGPYGVVVDKWYQPGSICPTTTCSVQSPNLSNGDHTWWVQTWNMAGYGPWKMATFKVGP